MFFYTDEFVLPLPNGHQFPMDRYRMLRERIGEVGITTPDQLQIPTAATREQLLRVHCAEYVERVFSGTLSREDQRRIGFPWTPQMVERSRRSVGATIQAALVAVESGFAANLAGGTHHASFDRGSGYCVFNDVVVTIGELRARQLLQRAVVIDCDVHQGDGTALLCRNDPDAFTFSIHAQKAFPARKQQSDLDIALPPQTRDDEYLDALARGLEQIRSQQPFEMAFYLAGADPFEGDRLGGLSVTKRGLAQRDQMVKDCCQQLGIPVVIAMAGGYAERIDDIVDIQAQTLACFTVDK